MTDLSPETSHLGEDRLLDLALGLLAPPAGAAEREHVAGCATCAERLRDIAGSHARARALAGSRVGASTPAVVPISRAWTGSPRRHAARWLALAAGFAVVASAFLLLRPISGPGRPTGHAWLPDPERVGLTRDVPLPAADSLVHLGLEAYARRDLAAARTLLTRASATGPLEQVRRIYLGSVLLELNRPAEAVAMLRAIDLAQVAEPWRSESRWLLAQALERSGRKAAADSVLRELSDVPSAAGDRAREALRSR